MTECNTLLTMSISLIAAISKNYVIGKDNDLPWHIPEDLKHFRDLTRGKTVLMGRKTWESIPEKFRPLPKRTNIVITRNADYELPEGVILSDNIKAVLENYKDEEVMVIGGGGIYAQTIDMADTLYMTHIDMEVEGDILFPHIDTNIWEETTREDHEGFSFVTYKKK
jgi:dihydrofolate reductase